MLEILPYSPEHLSAVYEIEKNSNPIPWTLKSLEDDISKMESIYFTAALNGEIIGFCGMWHIVNEGHIVNIAVKEENRKRGVGTALLQNLTEAAVRLEMLGILLEVRSNNYAAQRLYLRHGFQIERIRKNYYSDTGEDAFVLFKPLAKGI